LPVLRYAKCGGGRVDVAQSFYSDDQMPNEDGVGRAQMAPTVAKTDVSFARLAEPEHTLRRSKYRPRLTATLDLWRGDDDDGALSLARSRRPLARVPCSHMLWHRPLWTT